MTTKLQVMVEALRTMQTEEQGGPAKTVTMPTDDADMLLAVADAAAALIKAEKEYREFDEKARTAKGGVRYAVYNNMADERAMDMYRHSEALKAALQPLLAESAKEEGAAC